MPSCFIPVAVQGIDANSLVSCVARSWTCGDAWVFLTAGSSRQRQETSHALRMPTPDVRISVLPKSSAGYVAATQTPHFSLPDVRALVTRRSHLLCYTHFPVCASVCVLATGESGKGRQKTQKNISDLCYHESFAADAVLMRKPIRGKSSSGRTFEFPSASTGGKRGKKRGETGFVKQRNDLVKHQFIPRCGGACRGGVRGDKRNHLPI